MCLCMRCAFTFSWARGALSRLLAQTDFAYPTLWDRHALFGASPMGCCCCCSLFSHFRLFLSFPFPSPCPLLPLSVIN